MKWYDYIYFAFFVVASLMLILQIVGLRMTKKQNKMNLSNAKFKIGQVVYSYDGIRVFKNKVTGIVTRKNNLAYELDKTCVYSEEDLYENYEDLKKYALELKAKKLDEEYVRL